MVRLKERWRVGGGRVLLDDFQLPERLAWPAAVLVIVSLSLLLWYAVRLGVVWMFGA